MHVDIPSKTAYRVALRRAAHQVVDDPLVFPDPLALPILGFSAADIHRPSGSALRAPKRPGSRSMRAFLVARARWAEDAVYAAVLDGVRQYVLLGAGLDTFACRNPHPALQVFEVDHPATQQWKRQLLRQAGIADSGTVYVPVDFQRDTLWPSLMASGFQAALPAVFAWLGVVPYLSAAEFRATLEALSGAAAGSQLLLDYTLPRSSLSPAEQLEFDSLAARVAAAGEPFLLSFTPEALAAELASAGWQVAENLSRDGINARYFAGRADGLCVLRDGACLLTARR